MQSVGLTIMHHLILPPIFKELQFLYEIYLHIEVNSYGPIPSWIDYMCMDNKADFNLYCFSLLQIRLNR